MNGDRQPQCSVLSLIITNFSQVIFFLSDQKLLNECRANKLLLIYHRV